MNFAQGVAAGILLAGSLAGCSSDLGEGEDQGKGAQDASAQQTSDEASPGKTAFMQCAACHSIEQGQPHKLGPNLAGVVGNKAGIAEGYTFSDALVASDITWTRETLDAFMKSPSTVIPGTKMVFAGIADETRRAQLVDYLENPQGSGQPAPAGQ